MRILTALIFLFIARICFGQTNFTFNNGGADQVHYYSSFQYENSNDLIIINVKIKDKTYRFIVDTGAPTTISTKLFEEIKPEIITKISISDANAAKDSISVVSLNEIVIGDIVFRNIPTLVSKPYVPFDCLEVDGLIGSNLLRNSILQIDEKNKKITITDDAKKLNLNPKQSSKLWLDRQSSPVLWIKLKNNKQEAKEQLLFDSGMQGLYDLSLRQLASFNKYNIFEELGKSSGINGMGLHGMAKDTLMYRFRLPVMEINGAKLLNVVTETTMDDNSRIGAALTHYGVVTVDYRNKKFYFDPFTTTDIDASEKQFPANIIPKNNKLYIGTVWDDQLNTKISAGDQVVAIDGVNCENYDFCDFLLNPVLKGKDKVRLITRDNSGKNVETILERK